MRKQIVYLITINSVFVFAMNMFAPLYALYIQKIEAGVLNVGGIWSSYIFLVGIFAYHISTYKSYLKYVDYFLVFGFLLRAVGWAGYIFASEVWHLYAIQIFLALGEAVGSPYYNSLFSAHLKKGKFAPEWEIGTSINSFVIGAASFTGAVIVSAYGFNVLFAFMILLSLVSTALTFRYKGKLQMKIKSL